MRAKPIIRPCPECGRDYEYRRVSGRKFDLCEICRRPNCVVCGKKVPLDRGRKNTCSVACEKLKIKNIQLISYGKRFLEDKDLNKKNHAKRKAVLIANPELMEQKRQQERERSRRRYQDPDYIASRKVYQAKYYAENSKKIQQERCERFKQLPDEEKAEKIEKQLESRRKYYRNNLERLKKDPEALKLYLEKLRQQEREYRNRKSLEKLRQQIMELQNVDSK